MKSEKVIQIVLMAFFGLLGSALIGFIFFNSSIFTPTRTNFQFVAGGLIGSLFFSLLEYGNKKDQIFGMLFILILNLIIFTGKAISISYLIRDVIYLGGLFLSIKLYYLFIKRNPKVKYYLRSLALAFIYGLINIVCGSVILFINSDWNFPTASFIYFLAKYGVLIGFGIGLGIDFYYQNKKNINGLLKIK
jgi:hypothetical protein